ncbi:MAG TPA: FecR domain-containing protein [Roseivirga sp.]
MDFNFRDKDDFLAKWLSGELSPEEKQQFENTADAEEFSKMIASVEKLTFPSYDVESELTLLQKRKETDLATKSINPFWKFAVAAMLIVGISLIYFLSKPRYEVFKTTFGEVQTITLPDQSTVTLNVNSSIKFLPKKFSEERKLTLEGEGFFEVTAGNNFMIETSLGTVQVLGTSFNVNQRKDKLDVQVYSGVVRVSQKEESRILEQGDVLRISNGVLIDSLGFSEEEKPLWITDQVVVLRDVTLEQALESLRNSFGIEVETDVSIDSKRFNGSYPANNEQIAIQIILTTAKIEYQYDSDAKQLKLIGFTQD